MNSEFQHGQARPALDRRDGKQGKMTGALADPRPEARQDGTRGDGSVRAVRYDGDVVGTEGTQVDVC